jgi:hypothetical protein
MENEVVLKLTKYASEFVNHGCVYNRKKRKELALEFIDNAKKKSMISEAPITVIRPSIVLANRAIDLLNLALSPYVKNCIIINAMVYRHHKFKTLDDVVWYLYNNEKVSLNLECCFKVIISSFEWTNTDEGQSFWLGIHNMVVKFFDELDYKTI